MTEEIVPVTPEPSPEPIAPVEAPPPTPAAPALVIPQSMPPAPIQPSVADASDPSAIKYVNGHPVYVGGSFVADAKKLEHDLVEGKLKQAWKDTGTLVGDTIELIKEKI